MGGCPFRAGFRDTRAHDIGDRADHLLRRFGGTCSPQHPNSPNWLGSSRCRLVKVDGLDLHVEDLDAVDGTPVLEVRPWFEEFGPRGEVRQPSWTTEMLRDYFAPEDPAH
ncbi:TrmO family methyltransferase domain-containing protein [Streptomyces sp. NRRL WC-3742]|uniref:TrmO family methyltransferase domain-containing protein n=1 Tax=Streptomyces sp. NRRL WC-3742 TaxID=1463934 RepID=UPI00099E17B2